MHLNNNNNNKIIITKMLLYLKSLINDEIKQNKIKLF